jgi:hypothetical protein
VGVKQQPNQPTNQTCLKNFAKNPHDGGTSLTLLSESSLALKR